MKLEIPATPAGRFAAIVETLCRAVAARAAKERVLEAVLCLVWSRLSRIKAKVARFAARIPAEAPPRPHVSRAARCRAARHRATQPETAGRRWKNLPRRAGWLLRLVPTAAAGARSQLQYFLAEPDTAALVAASPGIRRQLRPLCRMLGLDPPPSPEPAKAEPPSPEPKPAEPQLPERWHNAPLPRSATPRGTAPRQRDGKRPSAAGGRAGESLPAGFVRDGPGPRR